MCYQCRKSHRAVQGEQLFGTPVKIMNVQWHHSKRKNFSGRSIKRYDSKQTYRYFSLLFFFFEQIPLHTIFLDFVTFLECMLMCSSEIIRFVIANITVDSLDGVIF